MSLPGRPDGSGAEAGGAFARPSDPLDVLVKLAQAVAGVLLVLVMLAVVAGVVARAGLGAPLAWVLELSGAALLYITFLATAYVARNDDHVRLEIIDTLLPARAVRILDIFALLFQLAVAATLLYASATLALSDLERGTHTGGFLRISRWMVGIVVPVGSGLLVLQLVRNLVRRIRGTPPPSVEP